MQMKTEQYQERCFDSLRCENCGDYHDNNNEAQIMAQCMMIIAPPIQRMPGVSRQPVSNNPQPVDIRDNTRPRHQCAVAFAKISRNPQAIRSMFGIDEIYHLDRKIELNGKALRRLLWDLAARPYDHRGTEAGRKLRGSPHMRIGLLYFAFP